MSRWGSTVTAERSGERPDSASVHRRGAGYDVCCRDGGGRRTHAQHGGQGAPSERTGLAGT